MDWVNIGSKKWVQWSKGSLDMSKNSQWLWWQLKWKKVANYFKNWWTVDSYYWLKFNVLNLRFSLPYYFETEEVANQKAFNQDFFQFFTIMYFPRALCFLNLSKYFLIYVKTSDVVFSLKDSKWRKRRLINY